MAAGEPDPGPARLLRSAHLRAHRCPGHFSHGMGKSMRPMKTTDQLDPTVFVIFVGAGDLTWRKLIPALFDLSQDRSLPAQFAIIAVDRIKLGDDALRRRLHEI